MKRKARRKEEIKKLRAQVELLRKQQRVERGGRRRVSRRDEEVALQKCARWRLMKKLTPGKKLDEQWKSLQKQLRDIEKFTDVDLMFWDTQKEKWKNSYKKLKGRGQNFCRSTRGLRSCRACRTSRGIVSKNLVLVRKKCERSVKKWRK